MIRCLPLELEFWERRAIVEGHVHANGGSVGPVARRALNAYVEDDRVRAAVRLYHAAAREARIAAQAGERTPPSAEKMSARFMLLGGDSELAAWEAQALREGHETYGRGGVNTLTRLVMTAYCNDLTVLGAVEAYYHRAWLAILAERDASTAPAAPKKRKRT